MCVLYVEIMCVGRFGLGWAYDAYIVICHMFMHTYHSSHILILMLFGTLRRVSLFLFRIVYIWHLSKKLLHPRTLFILGFLLLLILPLFMSGSVMIKPVRTFWRTFLGVTFIWNARSFFLTSPTLIFPLSFTVEVGSPFVISQSVIPPWSYRSSTPICKDLILPYLAFSLLFEVYV